MSAVKRRAIILARATHPSTALVARVHEVSKREARTIWSHAKCNGVLPAMIHSNAGIACASLARASLAMRFLDAVASGFMSAL